MSGSNTQPAPDDEALVQSLLGRVLSEPQRPAQAPAAEPSFVSLLGSALGGGGPTGGGLSGADREQAGNAALMNFGINMLANSGWTTNKKTLGQIMASGLAGAQESMGRSQEVAAARGAAQQQAEKDRAELQLARIKEALPLLKIRDEARRAALADKLLPGGNSAAPGSLAPVAAGGAAVPRDPSIPTIGQQANNPGNLSHGVPGSTGYITAADGQKVGVFPDVATGVAAHADQLARYAEQGVNTVQDAVNKWVGVPGANTTAYINSVSKALGVKPGDPINLADPAVQRAFILAQQPHESGKAWLSAGDVDKGIAVAAARRQAAAGGPSAKPGAPPPPSAPRPSPSAATEAPDVAQAGVQFAGPGVPAAPADAGTVAEQPANQGLLNRLTSLGGAPAPAAPEPSPAATAAATAIQAGRTGGVAGPDPTVTPAPQPPPPAANQAAAPASPPLQPDIKVGDGVIRHPGTFADFASRNYQPPPTTEDFNPNLTDAEKQGFTIKQAALQHERATLATLSNADRPAAIREHLAKEAALNAEYQATLQAKRAKADAKLTEWNLKQAEAARALYPDAVKTYDAAAQSTLDSGNRMNEKEAEVEGKYAFDGRNDLAKERTGAREALDNLHMLRMLSDGFDAGSPLDAIGVGGRKARDWLANLGIGTAEQRSQWNTQQAFVAAKNALVLSLRKGNPMGALSDRDMQFLADMGPDELQSKTARNSILATLMLAQGRKREYADAVEKYWSGGKKNGGLTWGEAVRKADEEMEKKPLIATAPKNYDSLSNDEKRKWFRDYVKPGTLFRDHRGDLLVAPNKEY